MSTLRIDQQVAHVYVALQNLAEGRAISEIAAEIGVSRFTAARMVKRARELGLVEVRAVVNDPVDVELSARLAQRYGLQSALVVACPSSGDAEVREALAEVAAKFLVDHAQEDEVLGLTPGRTSVALSRRVEELPSLDVVQTTGVGDPNLANGVEAILNIGRASGGATYPLYAPIFVEPDERAAMLRHPANARTVRKLAAITTAYLTIGGWPNSSLLARQITEVGEMPRFEERGVIAEFGTTLLDADGNTIDGLEEWLVGIDEPTLRGIPLRVAVGGGEGKERALRAVLRSGLAHVVITDSRSARKALERDPDADA